MYILSATAASITKSSIQSVQMTDVGVFAKRDTLGPVELDASSKLADVGRGLKGFRFPVVTFHGALLLAEGLQKQLLHADEIPGLEPLLEHRLQLGIVDLNSHCQGSS